MNQNTVLEKSMRFAVRIVKLYQHLTAERHEYVLSKQVLRSGTSIGANIKESKYAQSDADFVSKLSIALKEAGKTEYWLELLYHTDYVTTAQYESLNADCIELIKLLTSIIKTKKNNY